MRLHVDAKPVKVQCYYNQIPINGGFNNKTRLTSYILVMHQIEFYKDPRIVSLNTRMRYFQIIHVFI